jgi:adenine/guanine phosphoribosyltransferase-like PRPP-binding protein
MVLAAARLHDC